MSDIVKRLRGMYSRGPFGARDFSPYIPAISLEAADEITRLRALLAECIPHVNGNTGEWRILRKREFLSPEAYVIANERIEEGDDLLKRIDAATQEVQTRSKA